jgi:uncharacterized protein DUF4267
MVGTLGLRRGQASPTMTTRYRLPLSFSSKNRHVVWLAVFAGALLCLIGVRFIVVPRAAANTFGLAREIANYELHRIVGLRDLWLGGLAVAFALAREWRALALWLLLGAGVCFADAAIAGASSGKALAVAFHAGSGVFCLWLGVAAWRVWWRTASAPTPPPRSSADTNTVGGV